MFYTEQIERMDGKKLIRRALDCAMTVLSVLLMGGLFLFPSDIIHEIIGTVLIALWAAHNILNRAFYRALFKGKYSAQRIIITTVNVLLVISCVLLAVSGILLSNHIFSFLGIEHGIGFARKAHLVASHWYFILIAFHFALHLGARLGRIKCSGAARIILFCAAGAISAYGIYAFIRLGIWKYLFLLQEFFFFDMQRGFLLFLADYLSIFVLFASILSFLFGTIKSRK